MDHNLELNVKNLGSINEANIKLNKINIIGGINASGKTTISKLLYCYIAAKTSQGDYLINHHIKSYFRNFINYWSSSFEDNENPHSYIIFNSLLDNWNNQKSSYTYFNDYYKNIKEFIDKSKLKDNNECVDRLNNIKNIIETTKNSEIRYGQVLGYLLSTEYDVFQLKNFSNAQVELSGNYQNNFFKIESDFKQDNLITNFQGYSDSINGNEMIYIDSPSIIDLYNNKHPYHYNFLYSSITENKNDMYDHIYNQKIIEFENEFKAILGGEFIYDMINHKFLFIPLNSSEIEMKNTSSGYKQLGVIQLLLSNRILTSNSFVVIDEPEINLHPDFQIKFAELLVKMSKELNITLYINSHSPQFIEALELYTARYDLIKQTTFYLSQEDTNSKFSFKEVQRNELSLLYNNLGKAYDILDDLRAENIINNKF